MPFEEVLKEPALLLKQQPKAILPAVLSLVPSTLFFALAALFLSANPGLLDLNSVQAAMQDPSEFAGKIIGLIAQIAPPLFLIAVVSWLVELLMSLAYVEVMARAGGSTARKSPAGKNKAKAANEVSLSEALQAGLQKLAPLARASFIAYAIVFAVVLAAAAAAFAAIALAGAAFTIAGTIAGTIVSFVLILTGIAVIAAGAVLLSAAFWLLPTVVSVEGRRGFGAFKRSWKLARARPFHFLAIILVVAVFGLVFSQLSSLFGQLPLLGYALSQAVVLPFTAWATLLPPRFYKEYLHGE